MTFIDEPDSVRHLRHVLGTENLMWSSDYPHPVSTWPKSLAVIDEQLGDLPQRDRDLMVWENADARLEPVTPDDPAAGARRGRRGARLDLAARAATTSSRSPEAQAAHRAGGRRVACPGVGRGDRVVVLARNTADYLLMWFALMEVGAVQVPVNPASTAAELAGFVAQVEPGARARRRRARSPRSSTPRPTVAGPAAVDERDVAVMIPTSGTTGRSKLVMQTHLAYVMAGEGFPYWMGLTADDRLMTSLPLFHINAPAYSTLGSVAARREPGAAAVVLGEHVPRRRRAATARPSSTPSARCSRSSMRQPERADDADTPLRLCYTGPSPTRERQEEIEARFGLEIVCGYALSETPYGLDLAPRHTAVRHARLAAPASRRSGTSTTPASWRRRR